MPKENKELPEPSEEFKLAVRVAGSISIDCELCGRTHFTDYSPNDFEEEGELKELMRRHKRNPDKYVLYTNIDSIEWGYIDGKQAVIDCPCHQLSKYERVFWNSKFIISDYFTARAKKELEQARADSKLAKKVETVIEQDK